MIQEFEAIAKNMQAEFERSSSISHQLVKGTARELAIVERLLKPYLPQKYSVGSGLVSDVIGATSKQQDIVIYDSFNLPVLQDLYQDKIFFAEQILSVIEVKSTLTYAEITDIMSKADSLKTLKRVTKTTGSRIFVFGFGYSSKLSLEQIRDYIQRKVHQTGADWGLSAIAVVSDKDGQTGLVTNADRQSIKSIKVEASIDDPIASIETGSVGNTLFVFYLLLMEATKLTEARATPPNYLAYAKNAGFGTVNLSIGKPGAQNLPQQKAIDILKNAHERSDDEVIKAWHSLIRIARKNVPDATDAAFGRSAFFTLGGNRIIEGPTPEEVWDSVKRYEQGSDIAEDNAHLTFLVDVLREVARKDTYLEIATERSI